MYVLGDSRSLLAGLQMLEAEGALKATDDEHRGTKAALANMQKQVPCVCPRLRV